MNKENERITYDEFMTMFKFAPRMCYTLYEKAEDEINKLKKQKEDNLCELIKELKKNEELKENYDRIYTENCNLREEHNITDISLLDENYKLKKQKDDVVEYIKEIKKHREEGLTITEYKTKWRSMFDYLESDEIIDKVLRMLGEIDG